MKASQLPLLQNKSAREPSFRWTAKVGEDFLAGVNYWPRNKGMLWWKQFDAAEVKREFADIARIFGKARTKVVRVFLTWEDFQPKPDEVSKTSIANLRKVLDIAQENGLTVMPTFFTGHMSGVNWLPEWALDPGRKAPRFATMTDGNRHEVANRDVFEDPLMVAAEKTQIRYVVSALRDHPALFGWDLSNEIDNLGAPKTAEAGARWNRIMAAEIRKLDKDHPVTNGIHGEDVERNKNMRPRDIFVNNDINSMHGYSMYSGFSRGPFDSDAVPFYVDLVRSMSVSGAPVLCQETGFATAAPGKPTHKIEVSYGVTKGEQLLFNETEGAKYTQELMIKLHNRGAAGVMWWNYSDYPADVLKKMGLPAHEGAFGLTRADGTWKPTADSINEFFETNRTIKEPGERLPVPPDYYAKPLENAKKLYEIYISETSRRAGTD